MSRPRAVPDTAVYSIADRLCIQNGAEPSLREVGSLLQEEYDAVPSYSTLKKVLAQWRLLRAAEIPVDVPTDFIDAMLPALKPLFIALAGKAKAEITPQLLEARQRQAETEAARDAAVMERTRLEHEISYFRQQTSELLARQSALEDSRRELTERASQAEGKYSEVTSARDQLLVELDKLTSTVAIERVHLTKRLEQSEQDHQEALNEVRVPDQTKRRNRMHPSG